MIRTAQYVAPGRGKPRKSNQKDDSLVEQKVRLVQSMLANKGMERRTKGGKYGASNIDGTKKLKSPAPENSQARWPNESFPDKETRPTPWVPPWAGNRK